MTDTYPSKQRVITNFHEEHKKIQNQVIAHLFTDYTWLGPKNPCFDLTFRGIQILHNKKQLFERIQPFWINYLEAIIWKTTCQVEKHHIDSKVIANLDKQREAK